MAWHGVTGKTVTKSQEKSRNDMIWVINFQEKLLKFVDKEKKWHKDMTLVVESEKTMKQNFNEMERKLQEKEK